MSHLLNRLEKKFGRWSVPHLTGVLIVCWIIGYVLQIISPSAAAYMQLNIYGILHGQIWRLVTWVIVPPDSLSVFTIIMLFFYFSIGVSLERAWGDFRYNVYIFGGMLIFIVTGFLTYLSFSLQPGAAQAAGATIGQYFTTFYIAMTMMLAYAATFPDATVLLMFVIPLKMKWLGIVYAAFMAYDAITYVRAALANGNPLYYIPVIAILASFLNFALFLAANKPGGVHLTREQKAMRKKFRENVMRAEHARTAPSDEDGQEVRHRCEVCGRTDVSDPDLEFRYCTKCSGAHEYCMDHLFTHEHVKE